MRGFTSKLSISIFQITSNWLNQLLLQLLSLFLGKILSLYWAKVQLLHTIYICNISWTGLQIRVGLSLCYFILYFKIPSDGPCGSSLNAQSNMAHGSEIVLKWSGALEKEKCNFHPVQDNSIAPWEQLQIEWKFDGKEVNLCFFIEVLIWNPSFRSDGGTPPALLSSNPVFTGGLWQGQWRSKSQLCVSIFHILDTTTR